MRAEQALPPAQPNHAIPFRRPPPPPARAAQVAGRTNDAAGDGTTTAACLAREMIHFGLQCVTAGANPIAVKRGIDKTAEHLVAKLRENAKPVQGRNDIKVGGWGSGFWGGGALGRRGVWSVGRGRGWHGGGVGASRDARSPPERERPAKSRPPSTPAGAPLPIAPPFPFRTLRPSARATTTLWAR